MNGSAPLPPPPFWRTVYFDREVLRRPDRRDIRPEDVLAVLASPSRVEIQPDGRRRHWGYVGRVGRWLRVVTLRDGRTVHNAFYDRRFKP